MHVEFTAVEELWEDMNISKLCIVARITPCHVLNMWISTSLEKKSHLLKEVPLSEDCKRSLSIAINEVDIGSTRQYLDR